MKVNVKRYEYTKGSSNKYWEIWTEPNSTRMARHWGRIGTGGQVQLGNLSSLGVNDLVLQKITKGYVCIYDSQVSEPNFSIVSWDATHIRLASQCIAEKKPITPGTSTTEYIEAQKILSTQQDNSKLYSFNIERWFSAKFKYYTELWQSVHDHTVMKISYHKDEPDNKEILFLHKSKLGTERDCLKQNNYKQSTTRFQTTLMTLQQVKTFVIPWKESDKKRAKEKDKPVVKKFMPEDAHMELFNIMLDND